MEQGAFYWLRPAVTAEPQRRTKAIALIQRGAYNFLSGYSEKSS